MTSALHTLHLLSDAARLGLAGGFCLVLAGLAWLGQLRRMRRRHQDAVGWVPWNGLSVLFFGVALLLFMLAAQGAGR